MSFDHQEPQIDEMPERGRPQWVLGAGLPLDDPRSPLAPYFLRGSHVAATALLAGLFLFLTFVPLWHTDIWGHLKFGQWMVQTGQLPSGEPFTPFADPNAPTLHTYWLSQSFLYLVFHAGEWLAGGDDVRRLEGGVAMLHLLHALIVVARCGVLLLAFRRLGCPWPLALAGLVGMLALSIGHLAVMRPQILGEFLRRPPAGVEPADAVPAWDHSRSVGDGGLGQQSWLFCHRVFITGLVPARALDSGPVDSSLVGHPQGMG